MGVQGKRRTTPAGEGKNNDLLSWHIDQNACGCWSFPHIPRLLQISTSISAFLSFVYLISTERNGNRPGKHSAVWQKQRKFPARWGLCRTLCGHHSGNLEIIFKSAFTLRNNTNSSVSADWVFPQRNTKNQLQAVSWRPGGLFWRDARVSDKVRILLDIRNESIDSLSALMMIFFFFLKCQCGEFIRDCLVCRFTTEQVDFLKTKATMDNPEMHHFLKTLKVCKELK